MKIHLNHWYSLLALSLAFILFFYLDLLPKHKALLELTIEEQALQHRYDDENQLMKQFAFPAETEHKGEHQRVLGEFKQFKTRIDKGLITFGRSFVKERLPQWFQLHALTMDKALVAYIKMQQQA